MDEGNKKGQKIIIISKIKEGRVSIKVIYKEPDGDCAQRETWEKGTLLM